VRTADDHLKIQVQSDISFALGTFDYKEGSVVDGSMKWLWITYTLGGGSAQRARVAENDRLVLP
jgi:hypothetical protein